MKSYSPDGTPEFADSIQICETTDKGHADNINAAPKQLLENDLALKDEMDRNFLKKDHVANNLVTTNGGWALDARQGKVLKDEINGINGNLSQTIRFELIKNGNIGANATISHTFSMPINTSNILVFSIDGNILFFGYVKRNSDGFPILEKIFGEATVHVQNCNQYGTAVFSLDMTYNRMVLIKI